MVVHKFNRLINIIYIVRFIYCRYKCRHCTRCRTCVYVALRKITANEIILFFSYNPRKYGGVNQKERKEKVFKPKKKKENRPIELYHSPKVNSSLYYYIFNLPAIYLFILTNLQFNYHHHHHYNCTIILLITFYRTKELQITKN